MIEQTLADTREEAATLRRYGQGEVATAMETVLDTFMAELREYLTWHDEKGAALMSNKGASYFRSRYKEWEARGLARTASRGRRQYREVIIPKPVRFADIEVDAEQVAREDVA